MARPCLDRNPKFKLLVMRLKSKVFARGVLELLWDAANECGDPVFKNRDHIMAIIEIPDTAVVDALVDTGFLDVADGDRLVVHDYWVHTPEYVRKRRRRELQRKSTGEALSYDQSVTGQRPVTGLLTAHEVPACLPRGDTPAPAPAPAHNETTSCSEPIKLASEPEAAYGLVFPVKSKKGASKEWALPQSLVDEFVATYGEGFPVEAELRRARMWCVSNPAKCKTARGMPKFLNNWLGKANDRGVHGNGHHPPPGNNGAVFDQDAELAARLKRGAV